MMRRALLLGLASGAGLAAKHRTAAEASPAPTVQTDLPDATVKAWNRFARHAREFFELADANPALHEQRKQQLLEDFDAVFTLL